MDGTPGPHSLYLGCSRKLEHRAHAGGQEQEGNPREGRQKEPPVLRALPVHPWVLGWGRWTDHAGERWMHLPRDAPLLTHGSQVAQNQLRGLGFSRAALSAAQAKEQSELPSAHSALPQAPLTPP